MLATLAETLDRPTLEGALDALAAALQRRFGVGRAAVALVGDAGDLRLGAISQQALADVASGEVRLLLEAMEEASERERAVRFPGPDEGLGTLAAHRALAERGARTTLASVPLYHDATRVGALLLERGDGDDFADTTLELLEHVALAVAPLLALGREAARGPVGRLRRDLGRGLRAERPGRWLAVAAALALAALSLVPIEHHVSAAAELVPNERRLVSAPLDGFVEEIAVGAGERVVAGQLLARLDRRELELEAARRDSEIAGAEAEFRAAMAGHDRQATAIARARLERERALRELVERRLERGELRAPIDGVIVSGDPADIAGAPIERGRTLFEIAPSEGYEVHLLVDETDVGEVHEGQRGTLSLRARPGATLGVRVRSIHPVAESGAGASRFRVRAALDGPEGRTLRPGESGVARLEAGRASLARQLFEPLAERLATLRWRLAP